MSKIFGNLKGSFDKRVAAKKAETIDTLVNNLRDATPVDTGKAAAGWRSEGDKIINDVPYIVDLNSGTSQQAPAHFIELAIINTKNVTLKGVVQNRPSE
jgi:hypothetical protein